jgi:hypothetical protein
MKVTFGIVERKSAALLSEVIHLHITGKESKVPSYRPCYLSSFSYSSASSLVTS